MDREIEEIKEMMLRLTREAINKKRLRRGGPARETGK
jgi:hypothetical protein